MIAQIERLAAVGWIGTLQISRTSSGWYVSKRVKLNSRWRTVWSTTTATLDEALDEAVAEAGAS